MTIFADNGRQTGSGEPEERDGSTRKNRSLPLRKKFRVNSAEKLDKVISDPHNLPFATEGCPSG